MGKLGACPWCDPLKMTLIGAPKLVGYGNKDSGRTNWHGLCVACGAEGPKEATPEAAISAWNNRRVTPDPEPTKAMLDAGTSIYLDIVLGNAAIGLEEDPDAVVEAIYRAMEKARKKGL